MSNTTDDSQPLITHLVELRNRLLRCVICILVVFVALVYFSNDIYHFVAAPLT
ncbi:twin-arginine translocase subunit TatC, partial [uncultured Haemophilus sp.]